MFQEQLEQTAGSSGQMGTGQTDSGFSQGFFSILSLMEFSSLPLSPLACLTAVKPAAVQKNMVKPAAIEIMVRVYYNDYGNHRNNTKETRF